MVVTHDSSVASAGGARFDSVLHHATNPS